MITCAERTKDMVMWYGEVCTRADAARILRRDARTIRAMLEDGRLDWACGGTMVDVRSIARYIHTPAQVEEEGRVTRLKRRTGCEFVVV